MLKSSVIEHFKTLKAAADAINVSVSAVSGWGDVVPEGSAYKLQVVTGGALQANPALYTHRRKRGQKIPDAAA